MAPESPASRAVSDPGCTAMAWLYFCVVSVTRITALKCMTSGTEKSRYPLLLRDAVAQTVSRWYRAIEAIKFFCYMVPILSWCFELICIEQFCFSLTPRCGGVLKYQHQLSVSLMSVSWNHTAIVIDPTSLRWLKLFLRCSRSCLRLHHLLS